MQFASLAQGGWMPLSKAVTVYGPQASPLICI